MGQEVLPAGARLRPAEIGGLMALGITRVEVCRRPRVAILSSGDEVVRPTAPIRAGAGARYQQLYARGPGASSTAASRVRYGILPDRARCAASWRCERALEECDLVVITAGSSASTRDLTAEVIDSMGAPGVLVHGVNVRPGKPTILAVCGGKAVIGLPGNPVSALVIAGLFVVPVIERLLGMTPRCDSRRRERRGWRQPALAGRARGLGAGAACARGRTGWRAEPIFYKSNLIFTLAQADGLVHIPADATGLAAGDVGRGHA